MRVMEKWICLTILVLCGLANSAYSADGKLEINQVCAVNSGCFAGDDPGFPVTITSTGSYLLTGNLDVPNDVDGIVIGARSTTLDLNGFIIKGQSTSGTGIYNQNWNIEIRNGTVAGFDYGIRNLLLSDPKGGDRFFDIRLIENRIVGLSLLGSGHLMQGSIIEANDNVGLRLGGSLFTGELAMGGSVITRNGPFPYPDNIVISPGKLIEIGINQCALDTICP